MTIKEWLDWKCWTMEEGARYLGLNKATFASYVYRVKEPRLTRACRIWRQTHLKVHPHEMTRKVTSAD